MTVATPALDVDTTLNYIAPDTPRDLALARDAYGGTTNFALRPYPVRIHDARGDGDWERAFALDTHGFAMRRAPTSAANLEALRRVDDEHIRAHYYPECEALLKKLTGAGRVVVYNHIVRHTADGAPGVEKHEAGTMVHVDHVPDCVPSTVLQYLPEDEHEKLKSCRSQIINIWRPLMQPVQSWPLAVGDYQSLNPDETVSVHVRLPYIVGTAAKSVPAGQFYPREGHRWNYLSNQTMDEVLVFKTYESRTDVARFGIHTAFDNPLAKDAPPRESVEVRAVLYYLDD